MSNCCLIAMLVLSIEIFVFSIFPLTEALNSKQEEAEVEVLAILEKEYSDEFESDSERKLAFCDIFSEVQRYYNNQEGIKVKIILSGLKIVTKTEDQPFIESSSWRNNNVTYLNKTVLAKFSSFLQGEVWNNQYDVILLLTKKLMAGKNWTLKGAAYRYGSCKHSLKFGIVFPDPRTIAHEIGHLLGADNDGANNTCSSDDGYLMRAYSDIVSYENHRKFSRCSIESIKQHLESHWSNCLRDTGVKDTVRCEERTSCHNHCRII